MQRDILQKELEVLSLTADQFRKSGRAFYENVPNTSAVLNFSSADHEVAKAGKIQNLVQRINSRITKIRTGFRKKALKGQREFMPVSMPGVGYEFDIVMDAMYDLENAALREGYSFNDRITAFRKIFYDSRGWDIVIPGASSVKLPPSWSTLQRKVNDMKAFETIQIQGHDTALSHLFAGLDALNHEVRPLQLKYKDIIPVTKISSNVPQATYSGDLGSVVYEYQKARGKASFRDMAMKRDLSVLRSTYRRYISDADMGGNADAYSLTLDGAKSVLQNIFEYYTAPPQHGVHLRYFNFANILLKSDQTRQAKTRLIDDIFSSSLAYAVGLKNNKQYVILIMTKPRPGIATPTFWEAAYNATLWVLEEFLDRLDKELDKIKSI